MWDLPGPGIEPVSPELARGFLTTAPPGKSHKCVFRYRHSVLLGVYLGMELYYKVSIVGEVDKHEKHGAITILNGMENMPRPDLSKSLNLSEL